MDPFVIIIIITVIITMIIMIIMLMIIVTQVDFYPAIEFCSVEPGRKEEEEDSLSGSSHADKLFRVFLPPVFNFVCFISCCHIL